jgi:hypothetical protein
MAIGGSTLRSSLALQVIRISFRRLPGWDRAYWVLTMVLSAERNLYRQTDNRLLGRKQVFDRREWEGFSAKRATGYSAIYSGNLSLSPRPQS